MIQKGILYTVDATTGKPTHIPIRNVWINFNVGNSIKARVQTDEKGSFSLDVPVGKYTVQLALGSTSSILRAGQLFEVTSSAATDAFVKWLYSDAGDINDNLLESFQTIANNTNASAERAKLAAQDAKDILASCKEIERNISAKLDTEASSNINADYTLVDFGTMMRNERKVLPNPFGDNVPVLTVVEIYSETLDKWGRTGEGATGAFVTGGMILGEGIYVQTGASIVGTNNPAVSGGVFVPDNPGMAPVRMHVWKVGGSK